MGIQNYYILTLKCCFPFNTPNYNSSKFVQTYLYKSCKEMTIEQIWNAQFNVCKNIIVLTSLIFYQGSMHFLAYTIQYMLKWINLKWRILIYKCLGLNCLTSSQKSGICFCKCETDLVPSIWKIQLWLMKKGNGRKRSDPI